VTSSTFISPLRVKESYRWWSVTSSTFISPREGLCLVSADCTVESYLPSTRPCHGSTSSTHVHLDTIDSVDRLLRHRSSPPPPLLIHKSSQGRVRVCLIRECLGSGDRVVGCDDLRIANHRADYSLRDRRHASSC
jgi:hypothetical protein